MELKQKKFLYGFEGLIDRLSISLLKEVKIPELKEKAIKDKLNILHDIDLDIKNKNIKLSANLIHAIIILTEINCIIWENESAARKGKKQDLKKLFLTHGLNGLRLEASKKILDYIGEENIDKKKDCLAAEAGISKKFEQWRHFWPEFNRKKRQ